MAPMISLEEAKRAHVIAILEAHGGNKMQACKTLNISVKTLYNFLHHWGLFRKYAKHGEFELKMCQLLRDKMIATDREPIPDGYIEGRPVFLQGDTFDTGRTNAKAINDFSGLPTGISTAKDTK